MPLGFSGFLFNINPIGTEVTESEFERHLAYFPHAKRINYGNASVYSYNWMGKDVWVGMYHFETKKYYVLEV